MAADRKNYRSCQTHLVCQSFTRPRDCCYVIKHSPNLRPDSLDSSGPDCDVSGLKSLWSQESLVLIEFEPTKRRLCEDLWDLPFELASWVCSWACLISFLLLPKLLTFFFIILWTQYLRPCWPLLLSVLFNIKLILSMAIISRVHLLHYVVYIVL